MGQLIPENTTRKIDSLGRITLPKGLRDRMLLVDGSELELFTANVDGRQCICLSAPIDEATATNNAIAYLLEKGYKVVEE